MVYLCIFTYMNGEFYGKCRYIYTIVPWLLWVMVGISLDILTPLRSNPTSSATTKVTSIQMLEVPRVQSSEGSDASNQESDFLLGRFEGLLGGGFKHLFFKPLYLGK